MHHVTRKPITAKAAREPAIPPTTAPVLTEPEELAVAEEVADVIVPVPRVIPVSVPMVVVCTVTAAVGVVDSTVSETTFEEDVDEVEMLEEVLLLEDVTNEDVVEDDEVVVGMVEAEDCWTDVVIGVVEVGVAVVAGAEVGVVAVDFCVLEGVLLEVGKTDSTEIFGLYRAARRMRMRCACVDIIQTSIDFDRDFFLFCVKSESVKE